MFVLSLSQGIYLVWALVWRRGLLASACGGSAPGMLLGLQMGMGEGLRGDPGRNLPFGLLKACQTIGC